MGFIDLLDNARAGDSVATEQLLKLYNPLLIRESMIDGIFDQELYSELCAELVSAARQFRKPTL